MKNQEKIYKFKCGCIGPSKKVFSKNVCKKCGEGIIGGVHICADCGIQFISNRNGKGLPRCGPCQKEYRKVSKKKYESERYKRYKNKRKNDGVVEKATFKASPGRNHRTGCKFYEHCLKYDLAKDQDHCVKCHRYVNLNMWGKAGYFKKGAAA